MARSGRFAHALQQEIGHRQGALVVPGQAGAGEEAAMHTKGGHTVDLVGITQALGLGTLPFTFPGLVIGSLVYSLPFAVQPLQRAFEAIGPRPLEAAATLGASPLDRFFTVALPLARAGFVTAAILSFAHTVGEFGVVLMLGGNIPGVTRVVSVQIYDHVEALEYAQAHWLAGGMVLFSFVVLLCLNLTRRSSSAIS